MIIIIDNNNNDNNNNDNWLEPLFHLLQWRATPETQGLLEANAAKADAKVRNLTRFILSLPAFHRAKKW